MEEEEEKLGKKRRSKDKKVNEEGRKLCRFLEEYGWSIVNGNIKGDEEGEWTFTGGRGESVIDYVMRKLEKNREDDSGREDGLEPSSGNGMVRRRVERRKKKRGKARRLRGVWTKEGKKEFTRLVGSRIEGAGGVEEEWKELKRRIGEALERVEGLKKEERVKGW